MLLRSATTADDRIDVFVVPSWSLPGKAFPDYEDDLNVSTLGPLIKPVAPLDPLAPKVLVSSVPVDKPTLDRHLPKGPYRRAVIIACTSGGVQVLDENERAPFTLPHEIGHVLGDMGHLKNCPSNPPGTKVDLMYGDWPKDNAVDAAKRILSAPLLVEQVSLVSNVLPTDLQQNVKDTDVRQYMRTRGGRHVTEAW